jgi:hypothetical protein
MTRSVAQTQPWHDQRGPAVPIILNLILLALASTFRPASIAAVYTFVRADSPRRLMTIYIVAGLAFTVAFGIVVIASLKGAHLRPGTGRTKGIAEMAGGVLAILLGIGILTRRLGGHTEDAPTVHGPWEEQPRRQISAKTALLAGPATHIPGLLYLIALDLIVASQSHIAGGLFDVFLYNALWFALPVGALAICIMDPQAAYETLEAVQAAVSRHRRTIMLAASFGLGAGLLITGALTA